MIEYVNNIVTIISNSDNLVNQRSHYSVMHSTYDNF